MRGVWNFAIYALLATSTAAAQGVSKPQWPLDSGTKVRVQAMALGPSFRRGTLTSTTRDSIVIEPVRANKFSVGLDQISSLQVLTESHTEKAKYTMIGLLIGAAETFVVGYGYHIGIASTYRDAVAFAILILVLLLRPSGLLGSTVQEKV